MSRRRSNRSRTRTKESRDWGEHGEVGVGLNGAHHLCCLAAQMLAAVGERVQELGEHLVGGDEPHRAERGFRLLCRLGPLVSGPGDRHPV